MIETEGWYDGEDDYHKGFDYDAWQAGEYGGITRVVIDFGDEGKHDYKTIWLSDWAEYQLDEDTWLAEIEEWYNSEYGEAV